MKKLGWLLIAVVSTVGLAQDERGEERDDLHSPRIHQKIHKDNMEVKSTGRNWFRDHNPADYANWRAKGWGFSTKFGFQNSSYSDVNSSLSDGSIIWGVAVYKKFKQGRWKLNLGLDFISSKNANILPESTQITQIRIQPEYHYFINDRFQAILGLGLLVADYNIKSIASQNATQITFNHFGSGTSLGLAVDTGLRFAINNKAAVDLMVGYTQYFGSPQKELGGLSIVPRVSFNF